MNYLYALSFLFITQTLNSSKQKTLDYYNLNSLRIYLSFRFLLVRLFCYVIKLINSPLKINNLIKPNKLMKVRLKRIS